MKKQYHRHKKAIFIILGIIIIILLLLLLCWKRKPFLSFFSHNSTVPPPAAQQSTENGNSYSTPTTSNSTAPVSGLTYSLIAGNGIQLTGDQNITITNSDPGSAQKIFGNVSVGGTKLFAESNTDTLNLVAGSNINLSTNNHNTFTISANGYSNLSGFQDNNGEISLINPTDTVTIQSLSPSSILLTDSNSTITTQHFLNVSQGGTGLTTISSGALVYGQGGGNNLATLPIGSSNTCLLSNGSGPQWGSCSGVAGTNYWQENAGTLSPLDITNDILLGGISTSSALVDFSGTSHGTSFFNTGGNLGIGTTTPLSTLQVLGTGITAGAGQNYFEGIGGDYASASISNGDIKATGFKDAQGWIPNQQNAATIQLATNNGGLGGGASPNNIPLVASNISYYNTQANVNGSITGNKGEVFDGRYIYFASSPAGNGPLLRYDTTGSSQASGSYTTFDAVNNVNANAHSFTGAVYDGRYVYYIPGNNGVVLRYDTSKSFTSAASFTTYDLGANVNAGATGFLSAVFDGRYIYYIPSNNYTSGLIVRYDTHATFASSGSYSTFDAVANIDGDDFAFDGAVFDGRYIYFVPLNGPSREILRYDTTLSFTSAGSYANYNMGQYPNTPSKPFRGGIFDGRYIYFVGDYSYVLRYDTSAPFGASSSYSDFDASALNNNLNGHLSALGGVFDGKYVYFIPYFETDTGDVSTLVRYNTTQPFQSANAWDSLDLTTIDSSLKHMGGAVFDGRYVYIPSYGTGNIVKITAYTGGVNSVNGIDKLARGSDFYIDSNSNIGIGTTTPLSLFDVEGGVTGGNAAVIFNQTGAVTNDIFTASASGTTKFTIGNDGTITSGKYTASGGLLYTNTQGVISQTGNAIDGDCIISSGSIPTWGSCSGSGGSSAWSALTNPTGNLSLNMADNTTTFSYNAHTGSNNLFSLHDTDNNDGTGTLFSLATGSNSSLNPLSVTVNGGTSALFVNNAGLVGLGTTSPQNMLSVIGGITIDQDNTNNGILANNNPLGDGITFGDTSGEGIASERTNNGAQYSLNFYTNFNNRLSILNNGNVGIGTDSPNQLLSVGGTSQFTVDSSGNIVSSGQLTLSSLTNSKGLLYTDSSGNVSQTGAEVDGDCIVGSGGSAVWGTCPGGGGGSAFWQENLGALSAANITDDVLIGGTSTSSAYTGFSGTPVTDGNQGFLHADSLTSGYGLDLSSISTAFTTGSLGYLSWNPGSATTATGDLLQLNVGPNGTLGNILNVQNNGATVFGVSQNQISSNLPTQFTSPGDVSMAYDLNFTNQSAAAINTLSPFSINAGDINNSSNLSLTTYNTGVVEINSQTLQVDQGATISSQLVIGTTAPNSANIGNFYLTNDQTYGKALAIFNQTENADILTASASGTTVFDIQHDGNIGINDASPDINNTLKVNGSLCVNDSPGACSDNTPGTIYAHATSITGADYAENYVSSQVLTPGDLVALANDGNDQAVVKATSQSTQVILGVVSTDPGVTINSHAKTDNTHPHLYPIALIGRIPVRVSTANGTIAPGDPLTTSTTAGVAVKATQAGVIIGRALQAYTAADTQSVGSVLASSNVTWYDPSVVIASTGDITTVPASVATTTSTDSFLTQLQQTVTTQAERLTKDETSIASLSATLDSLSLGNETGSSSSYLTQLLQSPENLTSTIATISGTLSVTGRTTLNDLGVTGNLTAGLLSINGLAGTIDTIGTSLNLQSEAAAPIDIEGGAMSISTNGDVITSGEITAQKFNINTSNKLSSSVGTGILSAGSSVITINTSAVSGSSFIFITPTTKTLSSFTLSATNQIKHTSFTVSINQSINQDIGFNWWIIN